MPNQYIQQVEETPWYRKPWNLLTGFFAAIAAAFVFNKNPDVAEKVDEYTLGLASKMGGVFGKAVGMVKETFDVAPTRDQVVDKREVNGVEVATVKPVLANSALALNPENYLILGRLDKVIKELEKNTTSTSDEKKGKSEINDKRNHSINVAKMILEVNNAADESISKNGGRVIINNVDLTLPKVAMNIKQPPKILEEYGDEKIGDAWKGIKNDNAGNITKLRLLEKQIEQMVAEKPDLRKSALRGEDDDRGLGIERAAFLGSDFVLGNTSVGRWLGSDSRKEAQLRYMIDKSIEDKDFSNALTQVRSGIGYFDKVGNDKTSDKKEGEKYGELVSDLKNIEKYIQARLMKEELYKYSNEVYTEISRAAVSAKELYEEHNRKAKDYVVANGAVASVVSTIVAERSDSSGKAKNNINGGKPSSVADDRATVAAGQDRAKPASKDELAMQSAMNQVGSLGIPNNITTTDKNGKTSQEVSYIPYGGNVGGKDSEILQK